MRIPFRLIFCAFFLTFSIHLHSKPFWTTFPDSLTVSIDSIFSPSCLNGNDGEIFITVSGGLAPYTFNWSTGSNLEDLTGQPSGLYNLTVTDAGSSSVVMAGIFLPQPQNPVNVQLVFLERPGCSGQLGSLGVATTGGGTPYNYSWNTGETTDSIFYLVEGTYAVTVEDSNGCLDSLEIYLAPLLPIATILNDGDIVCGHPMVRLDGTTSFFTPNTIFTWTAPSGVTFDTPADSIVVFTSKEGTYSLSLVDTTNNCVSYVSHVIEIDTLAPIVDAGPDLSLACTNTVANLFGTTLVGPSHSIVAKWTAQNGGIIAVDGDSLTVLVAHAGTYILSIEIPENGCIASDTTIVTGSSEAPILAVSGDTISCFSPLADLVAQVDTTNIVFGWTGPNGFNSNELEATVSQAGSYIFTATDTITGCSSVATATVVDIIELPTIAASGGVISCLAQSVTLVASSSSSSITMAWNGPNGFYSTEPLPVVSIGGDYALTVTDTLNGCSASAIAAVTMDTIAPIADAGQDATLNCLVSSLEIGGTNTTTGAGIVYEWTTLNGHIVGLQNTVQVTVDEAGIYTLIVTDTSNGCLSTDEITVVENIIPPTVSAQSTSITCNAPSVMLQGSFSPSHSTFGWTGPNGFTSNIQNPMINQGGTYLFSVTDTVNGCSNAASTTVAVATSPPTLQTAGGIIGCNPNYLTIHAYTQTNNVSFFWAGPGGFFSNLQHPVVLLAGTYSVTATNTQNGCTAMGTAVVTQNTTAPTAVTGSGYVLGCAITSISLSGAGSSQGIGISYLWTTTNGNILSGVNTLSPVVNAPGTYSLKVTNNLTGCTATATTTVTQAPPLVLSATSTNATCFGFPNGTSTALVFGGSGNISYLWSNGMQTPAAVGLFAGTYTVTVNDATGCTATASTTISQPASALVINATASPQTMPGQNNGTASVNAAGGLPPYFYNWSNGANSASISGLAPGAYTVTVSDQNFCTAVTTANVNAAACALSGAIATTSVSCFGNATGAATVTISNATMPVQYHWSNGSNTTTPTINGLAAGQYNVTVNDNGGCSIVLNFQIIQPGVALAITELVHNNVACAMGINNGSINVAVNGGTSPYTFTWSNGGNTASINNLGVGNYSLTVTDSKGCTSTFSTAITNTDTQPPILVLKNLNISLNANGQATVNASQFNNGSTDNCGIASWSASQVSFNCAHLGSNTVMVTATDVNGLQSTGIAQVIVADPIAPTLNCPSNITVSSACGATLNFNLPTVSDNCTVNLSQLTQTAGLPTGSMFPAGTTTQTFTYTDLGGNTGTCSFQVNVSNNLNISANIQEPSCANSCDGAIQLSISGGQQPLTLTWSNGGDGTGLCAGYYTVTIVDGSGCNYGFSYQVDQPSPLAIDLSSTNPSCPGEPTGTIQAIVTGGSGNYSYLWSNGNNSSGLAGISAGAFSVTVSDSNGCTTTGTTNLTAIDVQAPTLLLQSVNLALSSNASATLTAAMIDAGSFDNCGIADWAISPNTFDCDQVGQQIVNVVATDQSGNSSTGTVTVTVVDNISPILNCPSNMTIGYCDPIAMYNLPTVSDNCLFNPSSLAQIGGLPSGADFPIGVTTQTFSYTDAFGNQGSCSFSVTVSQAADFSISPTNATCFGACNGSAEIQINGGQAPFSIVWNTGTIGATAYDLCQGSYKASVTDANGCNETLDIDIAQPSILQISVDSILNDVNGAGTGGIQVTVSGGTAPYLFAWNWNGSAYSDAEDLSQLYAGDYTLLLGDTNGCTIWSNTITVENSTHTVGIRELISIGLNPNPAQVHTELVFGKIITEPVEVQVFDGVGRSAIRQTFEGNSSSYTVDVSELSSGVYTVKIEIAGKSFIKKLVVSK